MKIFDLHNDFLLKLKKDKRKNAYLKDKKLKDVFSIASAVWTSEMSQEKAFKSVKNGFLFVENYNRNNLDINVNLRLAIEDMHFISKRYLYEIINQKPIYCGLTWNYDNILAGGALEGGDVSLLGLEIIKELEKGGIMIDTAHLSEKSFMTFSSATEKPILCSHTAVNSLVSNNRNLKDYQIQMIKESGGLVGVALVGQFLTNDKKATVNDIARHIDYIVSRYGEEIVALGTDFYGTKNLPKKIKNYNNLILLKERLNILGYSNKTIENIFYKNAESFFIKNTFM